MPDEFEKAGVRAARQHLFVCLGPDCCASETGQQLWEHIKRDLKSEDLGHILRTKTGCFRICQGGPWIVIYPDGIWYGDVTLERWSRILKEHLLQGCPVHEWIAVQNPLA